MEFMSLSEIQPCADQIHAAIRNLLCTKMLVGKARAKQWQFLKALAERLLTPDFYSGFDTVHPVQAAQLKFEIEDKLRRFYLHPGKAVDFVFCVVHQSRLSLYGIEPTEGYPTLGGYALLVRRLNDGVPCSMRGAVDLRAYLEKVVAEAVDAEFRAYLALPAIRADELTRWFHPDGPAIKEVLNILNRNQKKKWVLSNDLNPSTKRLIRLKVREVGSDKAVVATVEYWYLRWWDQKDGSYTYPYRETNRQLYILKRRDGDWLVYENLRPSPRTSAPHRRKKGGTA